MRVDIKKNTDQLNFEDFIDGTTRTVTIVKVEPGRKEAQYDITIEEDDRYWRPPATVLKQLVLAYGSDGAKWVGKRATIYGDPDVKMKGVKVGGIRVSHLSHIDKPLVATLTVTRGQSGTFTIQPLRDAPAVAPEPTQAEVAESADVDWLKAQWSRSSPERQAQIVARVAELEQPTEAPS